LLLKKPNFLVSNPLKLELDPLFLGQKVDGSSFLEFMWLKWLHVCPELRIDIL
jgi:hypothetical protein